MPVLKEGTSDLAKCYKPTEGCSSVLNARLQDVAVLYANWENRCRLYDFREVIRCLTFCRVSWKEEASFPSFTLQRSFWMPFAVQPAMAPYLISTCCFSSEESRDSGRLHVFTISEMGKTPVTFMTDQLRQSSCPWFLMSSAWHSAEFWQD